MKMTSAQSEFRKLVGMAFVKHDPFNGAGPDVDELKLLEALPRLNNVPENTRDLYQYDFKDWGNLRRQLLCTQNEELKQVLRTESLKEIYRHAYRQDRTPNAKTTAVAGAILLDMNLSKDEQSQFWKGFDKYFTLIN